MRQAIGTAANDSKWRQFSQNFPRLPLSATLFREGTDAKNLGFSVAQWRMVSRNANETELRPFPLKTSYVETWRFSTLFTNIVKSQLISRLSQLGTAITILFSDELKAYEPSHTRAHTHMHAHTRVNNHSYHLMKMLLHDLL